MARGQAARSPKGRLRALRDLLDGPLSLRERLRLERYAFREDRGLRRFETRLGLAVLQDLGAGRALKRWPDA